MTDTIWLITFCCAVPVMLLLKKLSKTGHIIRSVLLAALSGLLALTAVNLCSGFTGVWMPVSRLSVACAAILGVPGVIAMLLLQLLL